MPGRSSSRGLKQVDSSMLPETGAISRGVASTSDLVSQFLGPSAEQAVVTDSGSSTTSADNVTGMVTAQATELATGNRDKFSWGRSNTWWAPGAVMFVTAAKAIIASRA